MFRNPARTGTTGSLLGPLPSGLDMNTVRSKLVLVRLDGVYGFARFREFLGVHCFLDTYLRPS